MADVELLPLPQAIEYIKGMRVFVTGRDALFEQSMLSIERRIEALSEEVAEWKRVASAQAELHWQCENAAEVLKVHAAEHRDGRLAAMERAAAAEARAARLEEALRVIAAQGPSTGPDGSRKSWKHWSEIARDILTREEGNG